MLELGLRYDFRAPVLGAAAATLYHEAVEQVSWADRQGFHVVRLSEHHGSDDGYCPSPLIAAAAMASRTESLVLRIQALILPLHDPVRVAEDVAVLDLVSRGRVELMVAAGYVADEFAMFGRHLSDRARSIEEGIAVLRSAWTGEPFSFGDRRVHVALRPYRLGGPPVFLGGSSVAAARRAARLADGFFPTSPQLVQIYLDECARLGRPAGRVPRPRPAAQAVFVSENPERAWGLIAPHAMHEVNSYAGWLSSAGIEGAYRKVRSPDDLRASGMYAVLTPAECLDACRSLGPDGQFELHPLMAGVDPQVGWRSLELFVEEVLPQLRGEGLVAHGLRN